MTKTEFKDAVLNVLLNQKFGDLGVLFDAEDINRYKIVQYDKYNEYVESDMSFDEFLDDLYEYMRWLMKIKLYRKIIRPIIRYAHDGYPPKIDENWYDDNEIIREGIISRFEKESDGMSYLVWQEKFVECGEIDNGSVWY